MFVKIRCLYRKSPLFLHVCLLSYLAQRHAHSCFQPKLPVFSIDKPIEKGSKWGKIYHSTNHKNLRTWYTQNYFHAPAQSARKLALSWGRSLFRRIGKPTPLTLLLIMLAATF